MTAADAFTLVGFGLAILGVYLLWGVGWACLAAGVVLFLAGGLGAKRPTR